MSTQHVDTLAYATVDPGISTGFTVAVDITLSPTRQRANAGLVILYAGNANNVFCKIEVTPGNPDGFMSIGRRLDGETDSQLAAIPSTGFANGETYRVTCGRSDDVIAMTVRGRGLKRLVTRWRLTTAELDAFGSATSVGLRTHVAPDEDDQGSSYDNFAVAIR